MNLVQGINRLKTLGLNTGEDILQIPVVPEDDTIQRERYNAIMQQYTKRLEELGVRMVVRPEITHSMGLHTIDPNEFLEYYKNAVNFGHEIIVFKHVRVPVLVRGYCTPEHDFNTIEFIGHRHPYIVNWGYKMDVGGRLAANEFLQDIVDKVNSQMVRNKFDLVDQRVEFTVHDAGVGLLGQKVCFWGIYNE